MADRGEKQQGIRDRVRSYRRQRRERRARESASGEDRFRSWFEFSRFLLALLTVALLAVLYVEVFDNSWEKLAQAAIPNGIAALVVFVVLYLLFSRLRLLPNQQLEAKLDALAALGSPYPPSPEVLAFFPQWRAIPWEEVLDGVARLDIVVNYFDSWVQDRWESLEGIFRRAGSINIVLPDPADDHIMRQVDAKYPDRSLADLRSKIVGTVLKLDEIREHAGVGSEALVVRLTRETLAYPVLRLDGSQLLLSHYDQFRRGKVDASAMLLSLARSEHLHSYWGGQFREFEGLEQVSVDELRRLRDHF